MTEGRPGAEKIDGAGPADQNGPGPTLEHPTVEDPTVEEPTVEEPTVEELVTAFMTTMNKLAGHFFERSAEFDLSPQLAKAFQALRDPLSMGELAEHLYCDASNVTGIVDRLESRGLVERKPDPNDRRVKRLVLTPQGRTLWQAHHDRIFDEAAGDLPCFPALSGDERRVLLDLLRRMVG